MDYKSEFVQKYRRAIVTGGAGFIGSHIVDALLELGLEVIVLDDLSSGKLDNLSCHFSNPKLSIVSIDISSFEEVDNYFENVDIVFHNAASKKNICLNNPARDLEVNAKSALNVMLLAKKYSIKKVVHASTGSVYGEPSTFPVTENHGLNPTSYYGVSKLAGERYVDVFHKLYGIDTTILRYFHVYGLRQETDADLGGVVAIFISNLINGNPIIIHGDGDQVRSFTYVKDVVAANLLVASLDNSNGEVYNVASAIKITINELADKIIKIMNLPLSDSLKRYANSLIGDIRYFDIDNNKIKNIGLDFTDFDIGLNNTIDKMKK
jgi:nucleoside-diphosphate-sugar epimerase